MYSPSSPMTDLATVLSFRQGLRDCRACPISTDDNRPVPWSGDSDVEFAIMGEAPGRTEVKEGAPLVGDTGNILRHWLRQAGFDPKKMAMMNAVSCRPTRPSPTPTKQEMTACRGWMHGQLEIIRPKVLITLGVVAFEQVRGPDNRWPKLQVLHGKPMRHPVYGFVVYSSYHPAAYLRGRSKKYETLITDDLANLRDWWSRDQAGEAWPSDCYVCGDAFHNWDEWCLPLCYRHSMKAGVLFDEEDS